LTETENVLYTKTVSVTKSEKRNEQCGLYMGGRAYFYVAQIWDRIPPNQLQPLPTPDLSHDEILRNTFSFILAL